MRPSQRQHTIAELTLRSTRVASGASGIASRSMRIPSTKPRTAPPTSTMTARHDDADLLPKNLDCRWARPAITSVSALCAATAASHQRGSVSPTSPSLGTVTTINSTPMGKNQSRPRTDTIEGPKKAASLPRTIPVMRRRARGVAERYESAGRADSVRNPSQSAAAR